MRLRHFLVIALFPPALAMAAPRLSDALIGQWHSTDKQKNCTYTLRDDGTFAGTVSEKGKPTWRFSGRWSVSRDLIHYQYTSSSLEEIPPGTVDDDKVLEIAPDHFVIAAADGVRRRYERVTSPGRQPRS